MSLLRNPHNHLLRLTRPTHKPLPFHQPHLTPSSIRTLITTQPFAAKEGGDYGTNPADPRASDPQNQGTSHTTRAKEHPGPKSPASSTSASPSDSSASSSSSGGSSNNFKSTRHDPSTQPKHPESEDVKKHNEEYSRRHDRPKEESGAGKGEDEKVGKGWWKGDRSAS